MEPITTAIVAAIASGLSNATSNAISDAYSALKSKLANTLPANIDALDALQSLENKPDSAARQSVLNEELMQANIEQSDEIQVLLKDLLNKLNESESGKKALAKYKVKADKIGVVGDNTQINNQSF